MVYKEIPLEEIIKAVFEVFSTSAKENFKLSPDGISELATSVGLHLKWKNIDWWHQFMDDDPQIDDQNFLELLLNGIDENNQILLVTFEGIQERIGFSFLFRDCKQFINEYEDRYQMEFFQDSDFIFVIPHSKQVSVLMHEGRFAISSRA